MVALDADSALHHVLKGAQLAGVIAPGRAEVRFRGRPVLASALMAKAGADIISLVLVKSQSSFRSASLGQGPSWWVKFC